MPTFCNILTNLNSLLFLAYQLFTEYGRLALEDSEIKPFQVIYNGLSCSLSDQKSYLSQDFNVHEAFKTYAQVLSKYIQKRNQGNKI